MSCCCKAGTGTTECCCQQSAERYTVTFSGISNAAGTGTGTGATGDDTLGCFLINRSFCLCYANCGNYFSDPFAFYEGNSYTPCVRRFSTFRIQLMFECGLSIGTGAGTGTDATAPSGSVVVRVYGLCPHTDGVTTAGGTLLATYSVGRKSYHCETTTRTLYLVSSDSSYCVGWPSTLTLTSDNGSLLCRCTCGPGVVDYGQTITYDVRIGPPANIDCIAGGCGCETVAIRICMKQYESCFWFGTWDWLGSPAYPVLYIDGSTGWTYYPSSCLVAFPFFANSIPNFINSRLDSEQSLPNGYLYYYPATDKVYFGWKSVGNINTGGFRSIFDNDDNWLVKYSISAPSFLTYGNNTLALEYQDPSLDCSLPTTVEVNYYRSANHYCDDTFRCDICETGKTLPGGWSMTISGVTGQQDVIDAGQPAPYTKGPLDGCLVDCECVATPCDTVNGNYCLAGAGGCEWATWRAVYGQAGTGTAIADLTGFGPIAQFYMLTAGQPSTWIGTPCRWDETSDTGAGVGPPPGLCEDSAKLAFTAAQMGVFGGVIWLELIVTRRVKYGGSNVPCTPGQVTVNDNMYSLTPADYYGVYGDQCLNRWFYTIGIQDFDCNGPNTLTLQCSTSLLDPNYTLSADCDCSMPSSIIISPSTECGIASPPTEVCPCATPTAVNPLVRVRGIINGTCLDCKCQEDLDICFSGGSDCLWSASFTVSDSIGTCDTGATQAVLRWDAATTGMILLVKDSGGSTIIEYFVDTSAGTGVGFTCPGGPYSMSQTGPTPSPECGWPVTVDLYMDSICDDCNPCTPSTMVSSFPYGMNFTFTFAGITYSLCCYQNSACTLVSAGVSTGTGSSGGSLYAVVDFGANPKIYARVYIYFDPTGAGTGNTLIGVYAFLLDIDTFSCGTSNSMSLVAGNYPECGWDIATYPYTGWLSSTGTLRGDACYTCNGSVVPTTMTAKFTNNTGACCDTGASCTLTFSPITQSWDGSITGCSSGETVEISLRQTGSSCSDFRITVGYVNSCDIGVTNGPPMAGCTCGTLVFQATNSGFFEDLITVTF